MRTALCILYATLCLSTACGVGGDGGPPQVQGCDGPITQYPRHEYVRGWGLASTYFQQMTEDCNSLLLGACSCWDRPGDYNQCPCKRLLSRVVIYESCEGVNQITEYDLSTNPWTKTTLGFSSSLGKLFSARVEGKTTCNYTGQQPAQCRNSRVTARRCTKSVSGL